MPHKSTLSVRVVLVVYQGDKVPCVFRGKFGFRDAYDCGQIDPAHILLECEAQVRRLSDTMSKTNSLSKVHSIVTHFDGHQHIHTHSTGIK